MSEKCLTQNQIDQLAARKLRGRQLSDALNHLENCESCRKCIALPSIEEILARFIIEPEEALSGTSEEERENSSRSEPPEDSEKEDDFDNFLKRIRDRRNNP